MIAIASLAGFVAASGSSIYFNHQANENAPPGSSSAQCSNSAARADNHQLEIACTDHQRAQISWVVAGVSAASGTISLVGWYLQRRSVDSDRAAIIPTATPHSAGAAVLWHW